MQILDEWGANVLGPGYNCVQPVAGSDGTWSFDAYRPPQANLTTQQVGIDGHSAYQVAVLNGYSGTLTQWLASLVGPAGPAPAITASVSTIAAGSSATVTRTGPDASPAFAFALPAGAAGGTGPTGPSLYTLYANNETASGRTPLSVGDWLATLSNTVVKSQAVLGLGYATPGSTISTYGTVGTGSESAYGGTNMAMVPMTPVAADCNVESLQVRFGSVAAGATCELLVMTLSGGQFTVVSRSTISLSPATSSPVLMTFYAAVDFPPTAVLAGQYVGVASVSAPLLFTTSGTGPGFRVLASTPGSGAQTWGGYSGFTDIAFTTRAVVQLATYAEVAATTTNTTAAAETAQSVFDLMAVSKPFGSAAAIGSAALTGIAYASSTPLPAGALKKVTVNITSLPSGGTVEFLILESPSSGMYEVVQRFTVTPTATGLQTFVAGVDFNIHNHHANSYLGTYSDTVGRSYGGATAPAYSILSCQSSGRPPDLTPWAYDAIGITQALQMSWVVASLVTNPLKPILCTIDGGGTAITPGDKGFVVVPYDATIQTCILMADQSGSAVVDIRKCTYAQYNPGTHPAAGDSITASAQPTLTTAYKTTDSTLTGWNTSVMAGDVLQFQVASATGVTRLVLVLEVGKS